MDFDFVLVNNEKEQSKERFRLQLPRKSFIVIFYLLETSSPLSKERVLSQPPMNMISSRPTSPRNIRHLQSTTSSSPKYRFHQPNNSFGLKNPTHMRRLREPSASFVELNSHSESGYRTFEPITASLDPTFDSPGDTAKEIHCILQMLGANLQHYNSSFKDIAQIQVILLDQRSLEQVESAMNFYLRGHYPPIDVVYTKALPNNCTIQINPTCYVKYQQQLQTHRVASRFSEHNSVGNISNDNFIRQGQQHYTSMNYRNKSSSPIGDILPVTLAVAYGYYGSVAERLKACMLIITVIRAFTCFFGVLCFLLVISTSFFKLSLRLDTLFSTFVFFMTVWLITTLESLFLFIYGSTWLYYGSKCTSKTKVFKSTVPRFLISYFSKFSWMGYVTDKTNILLLTSTSAILLTAPQIMINQEDTLLKSRLIATGAINVILTICFMILSKFSAKVLQVLRSNSYRIPVESLPLIAEETVEKKKKLMKFLENEQGTTHKLTHNSSANNTQTPQHRLPRRAETSLARH